MTSRKKLIEHSLPLDAINAASVREKSAKAGHPWGTHFWWSRKALAAARAVVFAQLVDDPESWPEHFPTEEAQDKERRRLHRIIEDMVEWPKSASKDQIRFARSIQAARVEIARSLARSEGCEAPDAENPDEVLEFLQEHGPPIYDPFCGGGSIPLEAQRLGLRAYGSDLNPVAVLITKSLIEFPRKFAGLPPVHPDAAKHSDIAGRSWRGAEGLAEDVRRYGAWIQEQAKKRIGHHYPDTKTPDGEEVTVVAWLWVRTVASPDPALKGAHVPLASSFVLSAKKGKMAIAIPIRDENAPDGWRFEVKTSGITKKEIEEAKKGTVNRSDGGTCILSGSNMPFAYIREQGKSVGLSKRLMALVVEGGKGKTYLAPDDQQEDAANIEQATLPELSGDLTYNPRDFKTPNYGLTTWADLFTARQALALSTLSELALEVHSMVVEDCGKCEAFANRNCKDTLERGGDGATAYADALCTYLSLVVSQAANHNATTCGWNRPNQQLRSTYARQAIAMSWDFAEANIISDRTGSFFSMLYRSANGIESLKETGFGQAWQADARKGYEAHNLSVVSDPPYYDNFVYADLADFFYIWQRKGLSKIHSELFRRLESPKSDELVVAPYRQGGPSAAEAAFAEGIQEALSRQRETTECWPISIFYAFKQEELKKEGLFSPGWASFLSGLVKTGFSIDGTWPIQTEKAGRVQSISMNALASSVVLICRKRSDDAPSIARRDFQRELRIEMQRALEDQQATIPLPDRRQAAIGPGIGVFSKYRCVREADDSEMTVATALALVNREIDAILAEGTEALDSETRFALEWYGRHGFSEGKSGDAISALQGFNLSEAAMNRSGLFRARGGSAKLLTREEMIQENPGWSPAADNTPTAWELAQHLARIHGAQDGGIEAAGRILAQRPHAGPDVLLVAERLYDMDNNRGRAGEALVWNELQADWPQILAAADRAREEGYASPAQGEMNV